VRDVLRQRAQRRLAGWDPELAELEYQSKIRELQLITDYVQDRIDLQQVIRNESLDQKRQRLAELMHQLDPRASEEVVQKAAEILTERVTKRHVAEVPLTPDRDRGYHQPMLEDEFLFLVRKKDGLREAEGNTLYREGYDEHLALDPSDSFPTYAMAVALKAILYGFNHVRNMRELLEEYYPKAPKLDPAKVKELSVKLNIREWRDSEEVIRVVGKLIPGALKVAGHMLTTYSDMVRVARGTRQLPEGEELPDKGVELEKPRTYRGTLRIKRATQERIQNAYRTAGDYTKVARGFGLRVESVKTVIHNSGLARPTARSKCITPQMKVVR